jgi:hypothetical protein
MVKEYTIKVIVDDSVKGSSSTHVTLSRPNYFEVIVRPKDDTNEPDNLAHELGHVIGYIFKTPGNTNDVRTQNNRADRELMANKFLVKLQIPPEPKYAETILESEKEAWEFAGKMRGIDPIAKRKLLGSYEEMVRTSREIHE